MEVERPSRRWKWLAIAASLAACGLLAALLTRISLPMRVTALTDDRLIGVWQSDADRTIAGIRNARGDAKKEAALRKLFGKLRVTYTPSIGTAELDGKAESNRYEVLGRDKYSVVVRDIKNKPSPLEDVMKISEFTVIHFDGPDSYWVYSQIGGMREYFKRVH